MRQAARPQQSEGQSSRAACQGLQPLKQQLQSSGKMVLQRRQILSRLGLWGGKAVCSGEGGKKKKGKEKKIFRLALPPPLNVQINSIIFPSLLTPAATNEHEGGSSSRMETMSFEAVEFLEVTIISRFMIYTLFLFCLISFHNIRLYYYY